MDQADNRENFCKYCRKRVSNFTTHVAYCQRQYEKEIESNNKRNFKQNKTQAVTQYDGENDRFSSQQHPSSYPSNRYLESPYQNHASFSQQSSQYQQQNQGLLNLQRTQQNPTYQSPSSSSSSSSQNPQIEDITCPNCNKKISIAELGLHIDLCENRNENCQYCGQEYPNYILPDHIEVCEESSRSHRQQHELRISQVRPSLVTQLQQQSQSQSQRQNYAPIFNTRAQELQQTSSHQHGLRNNRQSTTVDDQTRRVSGNIFNPLQMQADHIPQRNPEQQLQNQSEQQFQRQQRNFNRQQQYSPSHHDHDSDSNDEEMSHHRRYNDNHRPVSMQNPIMPFIQAILMAGGGRNSQGQISIQGANLQNLTSFILSNAMINMRDRNSRHRLMFLFQNGNLEGFDPSNNGGLSEAQMKDFPIHEFSKKKGMNPDQCSCTICMCEFEEKEKIKVLDCMHSYHSECIDEWLKKNTTCPVCKKDMKEFV